MRRFLALMLAVMAVLTAVSAYALDRPFPANILRGKFTPGYFPDITLDGKARKLAPSARIFNEDNRIEMPAAVRGKNLAVNYTVDSWGNIDRIWLLTAEEAAQKVPTAADLAK